MAVDFVTEEQERRYGRYHSDLMFECFWLLGHQFSPRLADIGETRFWRIDLAAYESARHLSFHLA